MEIFIAAVKAFVGAIGLALIVIAFALLYVGVSSFDPLAVLAGGLSMTGGVAAIYGGYRL